MKDLRLEQNKHMVGKKKKNTRAIARTIEQFEIFAMYVRYDKIRTKFL